MYINVDVAFHCCSCLGWAHFNHFIFRWLVVASSFAGFEQRCDAGLCFVLLSVRYRPQRESVWSYVGLQRLLSGGDSPLILLPQGALVRPPDTELLYQLHAAGGALSAASQQLTRGLGSTLSFFLSFFLTWSSRFNGQNCVHENDLFFIAAVCYSEKTTTVEWRHWPNRKQCSTQPCNSILTWKCYFNVYTGICNQLKWVGKYRQLGYQQKSNIVHP